MKMVGEFEIIHSECLLNKCVLIEDDTLFFSKPQVKFQKSFLKKKQQFKFFKFYKTNVANQSKLSILM